MKHYKTKACSTCPVNNLCTKNKAGRLIERSEHAPFIEQNRLNIEANPTTYKKRQAIIEHTYGIIKRQWGFYYISTKKGIKRASADVGFMMVVYNLRRLMNILDKNALKKFFLELGSLFFEISSSLKVFAFHMSSSFFITIDKKSFLQVASYRF